MQKKYYLYTTFYTILSMYKHHKERYKMDCNYRHL